jgi:hypothetical protein
LIIFYKVFHSLFLLSSAFFRCRVKSWIFIRIFLFTENSIFNNIVKNRLRTFRFHTCLTTINYLLRRKINPSWISILIYPVLNRSQCWKYKWCIKSSLVSKHNLFTWPIGIVEPKSINFSKVFIFSYLTNNIKQVKELFLSEVREIIYTVLISFI